MILTTTDENTLPKHGKIACTNCFADSSKAWGQAIAHERGWMLENNPCAWGARNPRVLVLGFSKGANQTAAIEHRPFDEVAFAGMRANLSRVFQKLGLLAEGESIDRRIQADEQDFAFGSLIRCSISKDGKKAGDIINAAASDPFAARVIDNCTASFLRRLPPRLKTVVMLSNDDEYTEACFRVFQKLRPGIKRLNSMAYGDGDVTWVHVIHPSGSSGRHIKDWLEAPAGKQARKRSLAVAAVQR